MNYRLKSLLFWVISFILMASAAIYQRSTGPTYPVRGKITIAGETIRYRLIRTWEGSTGAEITVRTSSPDIEGKFRYKRFRSYDQWSDSIPMVRREGKLIATLPNLPPAGKMEYEIFLNDNGQWINLTNKPVILRYKGVVPKAILIPHVIIIFLAMMFSTRAGLEAITRGKNLVKYAMWTVILFGVGGMILGPIIQKYAFGAFWTGWPLGTDLTDNKSLATFVVWLVAWLQLRRNPEQRWWAIVAALVLIATFLIPHSLMGSELDFTTMESSESAPTLTD